MELQHHGIEGQRWGHKNGPPYPLSRTGDWSAAEKRKLRKDRKKYAKDLEKKLTNTAQIRTMLDYAMRRNDKKELKAEKKGLDTSEYSKLGQEFITQKLMVTMMQNTYLSEAEALGLKVKYHKDDLAPYYKLKVPKD